MLEFIPLGVAALALVGTLFTLWSNRRKQNADANHQNADAAKVITDAAREAVELHAQVWEQRLTQAKTDCQELIKQAVAASEDRCEERAERRKVERDEELRQLREWANGQIKESCEARKVMQAEIEKLRADLGDERELRQHRDDELKEIAENLP